MKPFLKWAGGKRQLLDTLRLFVPRDFADYYEPFVGGGAMFFDLQLNSPGHRSYISDSNGRLMSTYGAVKDELEEVVKNLELYKKAHDVRGKDFYYEARESIPQEIPKLAAWMIFMNKTCFNGLYRVNKGGAFNVPYGKYADPKILDLDNLSSCSKALQSCYVMHGDFRQILDEPVEGDLVYIDPPYIPVSETSNFTAYTKQSFGPKDQEDLAALAKKLTEDGVYVIISGSGSEETLSLYKDSFNVYEVAAKRSINSKAENRGEIKEYIFSNNHKAKLKRGKK